MMQTSVSDLLRHKGSAVATVGPKDTVGEAVRLLIRHNVGALVVTEGDAVVGILSERDIARSIRDVGGDPSGVHVDEIMTADVIGVTPQQTVEECMALMTERRIRHLPVMESGRMVGIVSIGDVVNRVISQKQFVIEQLEKYITGRI